MICNFNKFLFHGLLLTMRSNGGQDLWYFVAQFVRVVKCSSVDGGRSWSVITFFFLSIFLFQFKLLIDSIVVEGQLSQKLCKVIWGILDRHHVWRSLDPTLDISSDFVKKEKKKKHSASFFLLLHLFYLFNFFNLYNLTELGLAWLNSAQLSSACLSLAWFSLAQLDSA